MPKQIQTPGSVLKALLDEYQSNPYQLGKAIGISHSAIRQITSGKSKLSVSAAFRLAKHFGQTPAYWLGLQQAADIQEAEQDQALTTELKEIEKAKKPAPAAKKAAPAKEGKKVTLADKRKKAAKAPGAKPARGKKAK